MDKQKRLIVCTASIQKPPRLRSINIYEAVCEFDRKMLVAAA